VIGEIQGSEKHFIIPAHFVAVALVRTRNMHDLPSGNVRIRSIDPLLTTTTFITLIICADKAASGNMSQLNMIPLIGVMSEMDLFFKKRGNLPISDDTVFLGETTFVGLLFFFTVAYKKRSPVIFSTSWTVKKR
jgi:hypothetical protein